MQHQGWINQARQHWQEFQPRRFKEMTDSGTLETALRTAADETSQALSRLIDQGVKAGDAWMEVRELHLFPPAEPGAVEEAGPSEGYRAQLSYQRQLRDLLNDE